MNTGPDPVLDHREGRLQVDPARGGKNRKLANKTDLTHKA